MGSRGRVMAKAIRSGVGRRVIGVCERADSRRPNLLRVLTYHRVEDPARFDSHLRYIESRYRVVSVRALLAALAGERPLPPRAVMITFDDAYREVGEVAWPVLRDHGLPATVFVPTAFPDHPQRQFWWDRLETALDDTPRCDELDTPVGPLSLATAGERRLACSVLKHHLKSLRHEQAMGLVDTLCERLDAPPGPLPAVLGWDELRRLAAEGLALGAHTRSHPFLDEVSAAEARCEVAGSLEDLRREIGETPPVFSYPDGRYCPAVIDALREAGVAAAFTTRRGTNDLDAADPLMLRRINVSRDADVALLRARLVHSSVYLNRWRHLFDPQKALQPLEAKVNGSGAVHVA